MSLAVDSIHCCSCQVDILGVDRIGHYKTEWHRYNVKRKCAGMGPIPRRVFEEKLASLISKRKIAAPTKEGKAVASRKTKALLIFECKVCRKSFKCKSQCESHLRTKKHRKALAQMQKRKEEAAIEESHDEVFGDCRVADDCGDEHRHKEEMAIGGLRKKEAAIGRLDEWPKGNSEGVAQTTAALLTADDIVAVRKAVPKKDIGAVGDKRLTEPFSCLFCREVAYNLEGCFEHMFLAHGFFVALPKRLRPDVGLQQIHDCGVAVVGRQRQCVWCWKGFASIRAVQAHMRRVGHCRLNIDSGPHVTRILQDEESQEHDLAADGCAEHEPEHEHVGSGTAALGDEDSGEALGSDAAVGGKRVARRRRSDGLGLEESRGCATRGRRGIEDEPVAVDSEAVTTMSDGRLVDDYCADAEMECKMRSAAEVSEDSSEGFAEGMSPFAKLYDFDAEEFESESESESWDGCESRARRTVTGVNAMGELVLSDGSLIGHKHYCRIYRQQRVARFAPTAAHRAAADSRTEQQLIAEANNALRGLKLLKRIKAEAKDKLKLARGEVRRQHEDDTKFIAYQKRSHKTNFDHIRSQNPMLY